MYSKTLGKKLLDKKGLLYPLLVIAAISVVLLSIIAVMMMMGVLAKNARAHESSMVITLRHTLPISNPDQARSDGYGARSQNITTMRARDKVEERCP